MGWDNLQSNNQAQETQEQIKEHQRRLAQQFNRTFNTDDGQKVLEYLTKTYIFDNNTQLDAPNITYESGYHDGEAGVVKAIIHFITQAETL